MKPLTIGQVVRVTKLAVVEYTTDKDREVTRSKVEPFLAVIVGQAVKQLGSYHGGTKHGSFFGDHEAEFEAPSLAVSGTVTLWQVRIGMTNKILMVHDEDLEPTEDEFKLPKRSSSLPKRIYDHDPPLDVCFHPSADSRDLLRLTYNPGGEP